MPPKGERKPEKKIRNLNDARKAAKRRWGADGRAWIRDGTKYVGERFDEPMWPGAHTDEPYGWGKTWDEAFEAADKSRAELERLCTKPKEKL